MTRARLLGILALSLAMALWRVGTTAGTEGDDDQKRFARAAGAVRELLDRSSQIFATAEQGTLRDAQQQLASALRLWDASSIAYRSSTEKICAPCESALSRILPVLDSSEATERIWTGAGPVRRTIHRKWPSGNGVLVLRLGSGGAGPETTPEFLTKTLDLSTGGSTEIGLPQAQTVYAVLFIENAGPGKKTVPLTLNAGGLALAELQLELETPPFGALKVDIVDARSGAPTAAVAGLYSADNRLMVPRQALSFDEAGFAYRRGQERPYHTRFWPGGPQQRHVFFVDGGFSLDVPEGEYTLIAGKGYEYVPVVQTVSVKAGQPNQTRVTLKRWIDMAARGWMSGDAHVHYARGGDASNRNLMLWTQAEDVRMANVVRMGDARKTYFEQYAWGKAGRFVSGGYSLVPGQEDPRTDYIGHTLHMNLQAPFRAPDRYYLYDLVFDEVHRQHGITSFVHVYQPTANGFFVRLGMTLNIVKNKVDALEICEFNDLGDKLYYEFLNLGFKLAATAGSDVPWGNSIGFSRMYAYTGGRSDPDAWFDAVKAGHTFVTAGPMLEFTVNGKPPGTEIEVKPGEQVEIRAEASGDQVLPRYLDIVSQGDVLRSVKAGPGEKSISLKFKAPIEHSTWIAARTNSAHTTPVYITVSGKPFWKLRAVPELVEVRLKQLHDLEEFASKGPGPGGEGNYDIPEAGFAPLAPMLKERISEARKLYLELLDKAKAELPRAP